MRETQKRQENNRRRRRSTIRRQSMTCKDISCSKAKDDQQEQENMEMDVEFYMDQNENACKYKITKKPATVGSKTSTKTTLMANNRALAAALEDAKQDLRSVEHENVQLKKQIHEFVEKNSELEKQLKSLEQLSKAAQFLVSSLPTQSNGPMPFQNTRTHETPHVNMFNSASPYMDPVANVACTTPPPDEPSVMDITACQSVRIETNDTTIKTLDADLDFDMELDVSSDTMSIDISVSEAASRGLKRKSCSGDSFAEPGLGRGDRSTEGTLLLQNTSKKEMFFAELQELIKKKNRKLSNWSKFIMAQSNWPGPVTCCGEKYFKPGSFKYHIQRSHINWKKLRLPGPQKKSKKQKN